MMSAKYGAGVYQRQPKSEVIKYYRWSLHGAYLERFNEQNPEELTYSQVVSLGSDLWEEERYGPGDEFEDCDCAGPNDGPMCVTCSQATREVYGDFDVAMESGGE